MSKSISLVQEAAQQPQASDNSSALGFQSTGSNIFGGITIEGGTPEALKLAGDTARISAQTVSETSAKSLETVASTAGEAGKIALGGIQSASDLAKEAIGLTKLSLTQSQKSSSDVLATSASRASGEESPAAAQNKTLIIIAALVAVALLFRS